MSRAKTRFTARYIRVTPRMTEPASTVRIDITGLPVPATIDEEILRGQQLARLIEVTLNAAVVAFGNPRKKLNPLDHSQNIC
jgi:hypothetical protein